MESKPALELVKGLGKKLVALSDILFVYPLWNVPSSFVALHEVLFFERVIFSFDFNK